MYYSYRSSIGLVCTAHIEWYASVRQTLIYTTPSKLLVGRELRLYLDGWGVVINGVRVEGEFVIDYDLILDF